MMRRLLFALITAVVPAVAILAPGAANAATATSAGCSSEIIAELTFDPPSVPAGGPSTLSMIAINCSNQVLSGQMIWLGQWTGLGSGIQAGCPVIDPVRQPFLMPPGVAYSEFRSEITFADCPATGLKVTVVFTGSNGAVLGEASATLTIIQPAVAARMMAHR